MVITNVITYGCSICVVTGYATYLAFQVMGAPDQTMINTFSANTAGGIVSIFIGVGTLVGGRIAGRKAEADAFQNGLMVGLISAALDLILSSLGGFSLWSIVSLVLAIGGGWLGGRLSGRRD